MAATTEDQGPMLALSLTNFPEATRAPPEERSPETLPSSPPVIASLGQFPDVCE